MGDKTRDTAPDALFVRSGDIIIMEGESRAAFHGVPRIIENSLPTHLQNEEDPVLSFMHDLRINMNVRHVYSQDQLPSQ